MNSVTLRGTGSYMNAKLIKCCKITRISQEQWFEPIEDNRRYTSFFLRFSHSARPQLVHLHCLQFCFGLEK